LIKLADDKDGAYAVASNFDKLPENVRNELLVKLAGRYYITHDVAVSTVSNFNKLPETIRNELLLKVAENKDAAWSVASSVASKYDKLPENVQNLLFKMADNEGTAGGVAEAIKPGNYTALISKKQNQLCF
jgi:hypothetical protein